MVARVAGDIQPINYSHSARQVARGFNVDKMHAGIKTQSRIEEDCHGDWIGQRYAELARLHMVGPGCRAVAANRKLSQWILELLKRSDLVLVDHGVKA